MNDKEISNSYLETTKKLKDKLEEAYWELGKRLCKIRDEELWAGIYDNFELFLDEMKMSASTASKLITVYKTFVVEYQIEESKLIQAGDWNNVYEVAKMITTKAEAEDWLHKATVLSRKDLRDEIVEKRTGVSQAKCDHSDYYELRICRKCGAKIRTINEG